MGKLTQDTYCFSIDMGCGKCSEQIENRVRKLDGIESVVVNTLERQLIITGNRYDAENLILQVRQALTLFALNVIPVSTKIVFRPDHVSLVMALDCARCLKMRQEAIKEIPEVVRVSPDLHSNQLTILVKPSNWQCWSNTLIQLPHNIKSAINNLRRDINK